MSIQSIYDAFAAAAAAGRLAGDAPPGLHDLLATLGVSELAITGGTAGRDTDGAWLTAGATFLDTAWLLRLTGRPAPVAGAPEMTALSLRLAAAPSATAWTFGGAFPAAALPVSRLPVPEADGGGLTLGPSLIAPMVVQQPALVAANEPGGTAPLPRLQGWLVLTGSALQPYAGFLGADRLWMDGTVDFADPALPRLALRAPAPGLSIDLGRIALTGAGIELRNDQPDPFPLPDQGAPTSAALLYATLSVPTTPAHAADFTAPLLQGDYVWPLYTRFDPVLTLRGGVSVLSWLLGGFDAGLRLPAGVPALDAFGIEQVMFSVIPPGEGALLPTLDSTSVSVVSTAPWNPPVPYLMIDQVGVQWMFVWSDPVLVTAALYGTMTFGAKTGGSSGAAGPPPGTGGTGVKLNVRFMLPDQVFTAWTDGDIDLTLGGGIQAYFGQVPPDTDSSLKVTSITASASLLRQTYSGTLSVEGRWPITAGGVVFNLDEVEFWVSVNQGTVSGQVQGIASLAVPGEEPARLLVSARYPGDGHWEFEGGLFQALNLPRFAVAFLGLPEPQWMAEDRFRIDLTQLWARYSTGPGNPYSVRAKLVAALRDTVIGVPMSLAAWAEVERRAATGGAGDQRAAAADGGMVVVGRVGGAFTVNRFEVGAGVSFGEREKTYTFTVSYDGVTLEAATSWVGQGQGRHQVLTVRLRGLTLGSIVRYFASLANPNANVRLDPPWDFLDTITLDRFALVVDPTLQAISLTYDVNLTLPFLVLTSVGIRYDRSTGNPSVRLVVEGNFLGEDRTGDEAISWDPVTQAPPAVPGLGERLIDLRYLGMGQHVTPRGLLQFDSISQVIDAMRATMVPVDGAPPVDGGLLRFDPASQWLLGVDVTVMDTVTLQLVLHDPDLYGVLVSLAGADAGSLAGLSFELMYKKVTADIGVFHARLQIPDAFRQLQFGVVSVTLGVITVDIYTNGNFRVDLGFPHDRDFSQSFAVEAGYFNGHGGIYFGLLNGATSTRVPAITNGTFSPVIELGVGLMVGVGRTFEKGPLSAGLYVDLVAIFEGTLAWFHPTDAGAPTAMYYWCRGTAGIVGKLYGSVDFKVISVQVSVEAYATVTLTLASHQPTLVELDVGVKVHASVKILFIRVSFSFDLTLQASFTIGESSPTPWTLAPDQSGRGQAQLARSAHAPARRRPAQVGAATADAYLHARFAPARLAAPVAAALARGVVPAAEGSGMDGWHLAFDPSARVFPGGETRAAVLRLVPALTIASVPVDWQRTGVAPPNPDPAYRVVFLLAADSAVDAGARTLAETHVPTVAGSAHAETGADTSFNQVAEAMLRWSLNALGVPSPTATVTLGQLQTLVDQLALPQAENLAFTWANLDGFLGGNLHFTVSGVPAGDPATIGGVPFPIVPSLSWTSTTLPAPDATRDFAQYQPVDATYEAGVRAYFAPLDPRDAAHQPDVEARRALARDDAAESMATFVFREYFLLAARAAAQAAVDLLAAFPHTVAAADSLASIAAGFPTTSVPYTVVPDDSVDHVASVLGMSAAELVALNPGVADELARTPAGTTIAITLGVTPQGIAGANPGWAVRPGVLVTLGDLAVPIAAGDTFASLAARYGISADAWLQTDALLRAPGILRAGAALPVPSAVYPNPNGLSVTTVAAVFYVRLPVGPAAAPVPLADWYAEAIVALNGGTLEDGQPLPDPLHVPTAYNDLAPAQWVPLPGDTLDGVADTLALAQNTPAPGSAFATWLAAVQAANPSPSGAAVTLPADAVATVAAGDTLRALATRLLQDPASAGFRALVAPADILLPLADVVVPGASQAAPAGQTLVTLAQYHGLSLEDLAARAAGVAGLLGLDAETPLTVPGVPALGLDALTAALHAGKPAATVAGQVARFMLNGLRLPAPVEEGGVYHATGPMTGLYALTGQQVPGPAPVGAPDSVLLDVTFTSAPLDWLAFADSVATEEGDTLATLQARHARLHALNPALRTRASEALALRAANASAVDAASVDGEERAEAAANVPLPRGMIVMTGEVDALQVQLTQQQLADGYPATGLVPAFEGQIRALPAGRQVPVRYPVTQPVRWRTTVAPALPAAAGATGTAVPTLWLLPGELMGKAARGVSADPYVLEQVTPQAGPAAEPAELGAYAWGTMVNLAVQRVPGSPGTVELFGADTADRQRLALLLDYLGVFPGSAAGDFPPPPPGEAVTLTLAWQLPASAGTPDGLTSTALAPASSFVVKSNLSTETRSGPRSLARAALDDPPAPPPPFASMTQADAPRFLALLWECSVVGGGGYWLHYEAPDGSPGVPDGIFDQDGRASLSLVVQLASQSSTGGSGWPVRSLFAFNNVAVVGDGVDPGSVALYARPRNPSATTPEASVQQGHVGFTLDLTAPAASGAPEPQQALQSLYGLVGYQLVPTTAFNGSDDGQPLAPQVHTRPDGTVDENQWTLMRVIPITRFARTPAVPSIPGFPPAELDPYAGVTGASTPSTGTWVPASTQVQLWFHDVMGNITAPPPTGAADDGASEDGGPGGSDGSDSGGGPGGSAGAGGSSSPAALVIDPPAADPADDASSRSATMREGGSARGADPVHDSASTIAPTEVSLVRDTQADAVNDNNASNLVDAVEGDPVDAAGSGGGADDGSGGPGDGARGSAGEDGDELVSQVTVPVGYTDPLQGVGAWPATTLSYAVTTPAVAGAQPTATLGVSATLQAVVYQPGAAEPAAVAQARALRDRDRFARAYYQVMQPDVEAGLLTSLQQAPPAGGVESDPDLLAVPLAPLRGYAAGSYALLSSLAAMGAYVPAGTPTLDAVATTYGVDYEAIGLANAATPLGALVATTTLQVPQQAVFRAGCTVRSYCQTDDEAVAVLTDPDNVVLPLQPGTELAIPSTGKTVPEGPVSVTDLVAGFHCGIETLVAANAGTAALLTPGFEFDCNGFVVAVAPSGDAADATLNGVATAFQQQWGQPYDATTVVRMNAVRPGMFRAGATLAVTGYVAQPGDTPQANGSGATAADLAPLNITTPSLFPDGTPLFITSTEQTLSSTAALGDTAATLGISPGTLLRHNGGVATAAAFSVPGLYGWPEDAGALRVPCTVRAGQTLETLAGRFSFTGSGSAPARALVRMNAIVPATLAPDQRVTVGEAAATTQAGDSFQAFADRFAPPVTLDALTDAIYQLDTILQPGALLLAPPATLPPAGGGATGLTPAQAAAPFGISPAQLLGANAGTPGLLVAGVRLAASTATPALVETTAASDSITAILRRFQRLGVASSIDALVAANPTVPFLTPGASVLLPPADAVLAATLGGFDPGAAGAPLDAPWKFPAGIFPVHVWLQLTREWTLVNEELRGTLQNPAAAARVRTAVPAARQGLPGDRTDGGAVTLTGFATALEDAVPPVRVATGKVLSEQDQAAGTDVWAVVFSDARIKSVTVTPPATVPGIPGPQPRTFALRPLANTLSARTGVELQSLDTTTGTLTGSETLSFQGVDLEVWAQSFLADLDLVLSVQYAPGAYVINPGALETLVTAKKTLAGAVAAGLDAVVAGQSSAPADRDAAVETLRQQLLASLSRGYTASAVLQYDAAAQTPWSTGYARFSGASDITFDSMDPQLKLASVTNSKVSLQDGASRVNLVVYVPDVEAHERLPMTLAFRLVEMEFNVATEIEGYDRSDWLTFVNPVQTGEPAQVQVNLGAPVVPLALRAFPPMPTLLDHHADAPADPLTVDEAVHWVYRARLQHQSAEQDEIVLRVEMNRRPLLAARFALAQDDLFGWLAQYNTVAAPLMGLLGGLQAWRQIADATVVSNALDTLASLATSVACAWCAHWGVPQPASCAQAQRAARRTAADAAPSAAPSVDETAPEGAAAAERTAAAPSAAALSMEAGARDGDGDPAPTEVYAYTMSLQADETSTYYATLTLVRTEAGGPVGWPAITCYGPDGVPHALQPGGDCGCAPGDETCRCYAFPPESRVPAFSLLTFELSWGPLHVASYQSAISTVWVTRNASLFGPGGPATTEPFVYQTPRSSYAEPVVPFISVANRLEIGTWSYDPATTPLVPLFATLFDDAPAGRTVAVGVRYGYQLAPGDPPLESYLPVKQSPAVPYDAATTIPDVCAALQAWFNTAQPVVEGGRWAFWIDMYSTVDPSLRRPVLQLKRLISPLTGP